MGLFKLIFGDNVTEVELGEPMDYEQIDNTIWGYNHIGFTPNQMIICVFQSSFSELIFDIKDIHRYMDEIKENLEKIFREINSMEIDYINDFIPVFEQKLMIVIRKNKIENLSL